MPPIHNLAGCFGRTRSPQRKDMPHFHGDPTFVGNLVVTDTDGEATDAGYIRAFEESSGNLRWSFHVPDGATTDIVRLADAIFAGTASGQLVSLNSADGKPRWVLPPAREARFYTQAPIVDGFRILFSDPAGGVVAVDAASGKVILGPKHFIPNPVADRTCWTRSLRRKPIK